MTPAGPLYRGHPASELARSGPGFEAVAELLWTGSLPSGPVRWEPAEGPELDGVASLLPPDAPHAAVLPLLAGARAARDGGRFDSSPDPVLPRARALIRLLAAGLALPRAPARARRALRAPSLAEVVARAFGAAASPARLAAIDALLVLFADHELNASTFAARVAASTRADLYAVVGAGLAALSGPLHGAASDRFEALVAEAADPERAPQTLHERERRGELVPGFGHPYYGDAGDPRARLLLERTTELGAQGRDLAVAVALVRAMEVAG